MSNDYDTWDNTNPDAGVVSALSALSMVLIGVWTVGIVLVLIAATRLPAAF